MSAHLHFASLLFAHYIEQVNNPKSIPLAHAWNEKCATILYRHNIGKGKADTQKVTVGLPFTVS